MHEMIYFFIAAYFSAFVATIAGFGSSTLLVPVAIFFMDIKTGVFIVACFHLFNNLFKVKLFFQKIDFKLFLRFGIPSIIFAFIGAKCISVLPVESVTKLLGGFLVVFSILSIAYPEFTVKKSPTSAFIGGSLSGFLAGLIGIGGAVRSMFLISFKIDKNVYIATAALIAMVVDLTRIPTYLFDRVVSDHSYYWWLPFLFAIAYLGVWTGKRYVDKINQTTFRKIVLGALLLAGLKIYLG